LEALLKEQPNDPMVVNRVAGDYEKRGEFAKAAATYEQALKLNPKLLTAALKLAELYAGPLQQRDQAIEFAKKARALAPTDPQTAEVLGHIAFEAGNFSWAYSLLQESSRKAGDNFQVLYDLGMSAYALGKVPEARQAIERSLKASPDAAQAKDAMQFLAMTGRDQKSAQALGDDQEVQGVLRTQPDYVPALMLQAATRRQQNDLKTATDIYLDVLRRYPDFAPAQEQLAMIYSNDPDNITKAYDLAMKARKTIPDDPELARTLAELSFKRKEFPYAIQLFQESAAKQPLPANDLYYLGIAQLQSRQELKGRESLQRALAAGLQEPLAQEAKQQLAQEQPK
jgi:tetratricopeptide (TPR) repeat protein